MIYLCFLRACLQKQPFAAVFQNRCFKNFAIFTGKLLCWSLFLIKLQSWRPAFIKKTLQHMCFPVNIAEFLRTALLKNKSAGCFCVYWKGCYSYWFESSRHKKRNFKNFFSKCDQIRSLLKIWSHLLKKFLMENLKVVSATFLLICFVYLKESTCETRKNVFYFTSKALFILEIIKS